MREFRAGVGVQSVPISRLLPADSPRLNGEDGEHIRRLMEAEAELPPIVVHQDTYQVIDGMHRLRAALLSGRTTIDVHLFAGDETDAYMYAVRTNVTHGLPLTLADRKAAAARIIAERPEMSDRSIAECAGVAAGTVAAVRRSTADSAHTNKRVGADGRWRPLTATEGRLRAAALVRDQPSASLREIARRAGISLSTAHDVRERVQRGDDPVPRGRRSGPDPTPAPPSVRARHATAARAEWSPILRTLSNDPALRQSQSGRELLRWLHSQLAGTENTGGLFDAIPERHRRSVARLLLLCAVELEERAMELDTRIERVHRRRQRRQRVVAHSGTRAS